MATHEVLEIKWRKRYSASGEHAKCGSKQFEILVRRQDSDVRIPAKFSAAVQNTRLPPHQQCLDAAGIESRKDFVNRVLDRGSLLKLGRMTRVSRFRSNALLA